MAGLNKGTRSMRGALAALALMVAAAGCGPEPAPGSGEEGPAVYARAVSGEVFDTTPVRGALKPLVYQRGSFTYRCSECHLDLDTLSPPGDLRGEHDGVQARFSHGGNTRCLNCHHPDNRNAYVDHDGNEIPPDQPARLCGKCHGTIYRDWEHGVHGRSNGYWDTAQGARRRLMCVQCHDPHAPAFGRMHPDPAPAYSRLAPVRPGEEDHEQH